MKRLSDPRGPSGGWRIAIVEDHLLQRRRTAEVLGAQAGIRVVRGDPDLPSFMTWFRESDDPLPHLVVLDLLVERGPSVDPDDVRTLLRAGVRVLVVSAMASPSLTRAVLRSGVNGIVGKRDSEEDLVAALWTVLGRRQWMSPEVAAVIAGDENRPRLSDQEEQALILYASGMTLAAVAEALNVRPDTAKKYLARAKAKYQEVGRPVSSKVDLYRAAVQDGLIDDAPVDGVGSA